MGPFCGIEGLRDTNRGERGGRGYGREDGEGVAEGVGEGER